MSTPKMNEEVRLLINQIAEADKTISNLFCKIIETNNQDSIKKALELAEKHNIKLSI